MGKTLLSLWALFVAIALMMLGNGLQGTLLGVRAEAEGFNSATSGLIMMGYFGGLLLGALSIPKAIETVGHVRVYAALTSLASVAILLHPSFINPWTWGGLRFLTGFCYAGLYIVVESWLNDLSSNDNRGRVLSLYMVITMSAMAGAQYLLNLTSEQGFAGFALTSLLISLAALPLCLTPLPTPEFRTVEHLSLWDFYKITPLGFIGGLVVGLTQGCFYGMGAVYASAIGLPIELVSSFMAVTMLGGLLSQWPLGWLSDRWNRRGLLALVSLCAGLAAAAAGYFGKQDPNLLLICMGLFGAFSLPMYSLNIAHSNDRLRPEQRIEASGTLILVYSIGAMVSPGVVGYLMERLGTESYFGWLASIHIAMAVFTLYRMLRSSSPCPTQQAPAVVSGTLTTVRILHAPSTSNAQP